MNFREQLYELCGLSINVAEAGSGSPMLFLHNGGGFWQSWQHQLSYFSHHFNVYAIDWPGCGKSEYPGLPLTQDTNLSVLEAFVTEKRFEKIILVGNCIGASCALEFSIKHPEKVQELVVMNICPGDLMLPSWFSRRRIANIPSSSFGFKIRYAALKIMAPGIVTRLVFPKILFAPGIPTSDPVYRHYREKQRERNQKRTRFDLIFAAHSFNLDLITTGKKIPSHLLLWGAQNKVLPFKKYGVHSQQLLRNQSIKIIEKGGHLMAYEQPQYVNKCIDNYLERHS